MTSDAKKGPGNKKVPFDCMPLAPLVWIAKAFEHGADKYGKYNWREAPEIEQETYTNAAWRHLLAAQDGEYIDPESGIPHYAHLAASVMILMDATIEGNITRGTDRGVWSYGHFADILRYIQNNQEDKKHVGSAKTFQQLD